MGLGFRGFRTLLFNFENLGLWVLVRSEYAASNSEHLLKTRPGPLNSIRFGVLYFNTFLVLGSDYSHLYLKRIYFFVRVYSKAKVYSKLRKVGTSLSQNFSPYPKRYTKRNPSSIHP